MGILRSFLVFFFLAVVLISFPLSAQEKRYDVPIGDSPSIGPGNAPVAIIEFLDYQ